jgi:large subunit ribosomal protein L21
MNDFAIIESGGKQYLVRVGDKIKVEKLEPENSDKVFFKNVLLVNKGKELKIGTPLVTDSLVEGKLTRKGRDKKKIVFRYHSKTRYRKFKTHRQHFVEVEITKIS